MTEVVFLNLTLKLVAIVGAALVVANKNNNVIIPVEMGQRIKQHAMAFPRCKPARQHDNEFAVGEAPLPRKLDEACLRNGGCTENGYIDAAADDAQARLVHGICLNDVIGGEFGIGNNPLAFHHNGIIAPFECA